MRLHRLHLAGERAIALPIALAVLTSVAGLATVAARAAVVTQHQSHRDTSAKRAIQAARLGAERSRLPDQPAAARHAAMRGQERRDRCARPGDGAGRRVVLPRDGDAQRRRQSSRCSVSAATSISGGGGQDLLERKVISTGTTNGVIRRTEMVMRAAVAPESFPLDYALVSKNHLTVSNNAIVRRRRGVERRHHDLEQREGLRRRDPRARARRSTSSNNGIMCTPSSTSPAPVAFNFPPVDQGSAATVNDNARITGAKAGTGTPARHLLGLREHQLDRRDPGAATSGTTRSLTLTGDVYSFCALTIDNNATLRIAPAPLPCGSTSTLPRTAEAAPAWDRSTVSNNGLIQNLNSSPATLQLYVLGAPASTRR